MCSDDAIASGIKIRLIVFVGVMFKIQEVNQNVRDFSNSTSYYQTLYLLFKCSSIMLLFFLLLDEILSDNKRVRELFTPLLNSIHIMTHDKLTHGLSHHGSDITPLSTKMEWI